MMIYLITDHSDQVYFMLSHRIEPKKDISLALLASVHDPDSESDIIDMKIKIVSNGDHETRI